MLSSVIDSVLRYENHLLMRWEDDRSRLLAEVYRLQALHAKDIKTRQLLQQQYDELSLLVEDYQKSKDSGTKPVDVRDANDKGLAIEDDEAEATQDLNSQDRDRAKQTVVSSKFPPDLLLSSSRPLPGKRRLTVHCENALNLLMPPSSIPKAQPLKKPRDSSLPPKKSHDSSLSSKEPRSDRPPPKLFSGHGQIDAPRVVKSIEVVRKKDQRECLLGFSCSECEKYYHELERQGLLDTVDRAEMLKRCSRHKSAWEPPQTPEGFWELSVHTPANWK